ncbi:sensor histidine kinase [Mucilaginibacter sp. SMC90]|uniref:sensor histidine kinase n=1 Tax=Mucilaginibacter sp. SMC90 TaxID=2929803 RepID=UPI001FB4860E|nr:sensor histidine kinase [Mucilaginibacter sp. SMC90]UOE47435.1 sensor histidine kinase [Mucilaginibacter sp. SMC90]
MKVSRFALITHALIWFLLLVIPYVSTDQVFRAIDPDTDLQYLLVCLALSFVLLATFYINYLYLIPRLLLTKKYFLYIGCMLLAIAIVFIVSGGLFFFPNVNSRSLIAINPLTEKLIPVIIINAISLWFLANITSVLWMVYKRLRQTESEKLSAQLASLKSQINPHFLFNTLNNIYATAIESSPKAADMVDKLSEMMRYTMKDTQQDFVLLDDEMNYINNYVELQKIRLDRSVKLEFSIIEDIPDLQIAPMLLIPFIENAFKHGVNSEQKSAIRISITINQSELLLNVLNNRVSIQSDTSEKSGLGIENTRHRLQLIYPSRHLLVINDGPKTFSVSLHLNLK